MNAIDMARTAYSSNAALIRSSQSTEFDAFARITHRLQSAHQRDKADFADLAAALHDNRRLWVLLAGDLADAGNALPQTLRAQLFYLAEFTLHHTSRVLDGSAEVDVLIDINTSVMRGLRRQEAAS